MNVKFCPDCQEECGPEDLKCPECDFPMKLTVTAAGNRRTVERGELDDWNRIVGILRRNGVQIENRPASAVMTSGVWWALPTIGLTALLFSIFMGPSLVDRIWEPAAPASVPVLDLNQTAADAAEANPNDDQDASFLANALKVSDKQKQLTHDLSQEVAEEYVDKPEATMAQIQERMEQALLEVSILNRKRRGVLMSSDGLYLTPMEAVVDAFRNETRTIKEEGRMMQKTVYITPMAAPPGGTPSSSTKVKESQAVELALLKTSLDREINFPIAFNDDLEPNEEVWVGRFVNGRHYLEKARIVNSLQNVDSILFWTLDSVELGPRDAGAPVFNKHGELAGALLRLDEQNVVLSMLRLREKAPTLYRYVKE